MLLKSGFSGLLSANSGLGSEIVATSYKPNNNSSTSSSSSVAGSPVVTRNNFQNISAHQNNINGNTNTNTNNNNHTIVNYFGKPKIYNNGGALIKPSSEVEPLKSALQQSSALRISPLSQPQSLHQQPQQQQLFQPPAYHHQQSILREDNNHCLNGEDYRGGSGVESYGCYDDPARATELYQANQRRDEIQRLNQIQDTLKEGWTVHLTENGRLYYCK